MPLYLAKSALNLENQKLEEGADLFMAIHKLALTTFLCQSKDQVAEATFRDEGHSPAESLNFLEHLLVSTHCGPKG